MNSTQLQEFILQHSLCYWVYNLTQQINKRVPSVTMILCETTMFDIHSSFLVVRDKRCIALAVIF